MSDVIKKLVLDLGKKEITLTMEQAKKLKDALDGLFGENIVREEHHHHDHPHYPYRWYWTQPTTTTTWLASNDFVTGDIVYCSSDNALTVKVA